MTWTNSAKCKDVETDFFFEPEREDYEDRETWIFATRDKLKTARTFCAGCPVINQCLIENLNAPNGVFGGLSAKQRTEIARKKGVYQRYDDLRHQQTPMTPDRIQIILDYWRRNFTLADIEELTGINRGSVSRVVHNPEHNEDAPAKQAVRGYRFQKSWNDPKYKEVRELLEEGLNAVQIQDRTGFHRKVVRRIRHAMKTYQEELCSQGQ